MPTTEPSSPENLNSEAASFKYFGFISYSRADDRAAKWLQKRLEWFRFPVKLVTHEHKPPHPKFVRPIYRDKTHLEVDHAHYWQNIKQAIEQSRFLIVLCSPHSAKSGPVNLEVSHFLETRRSVASVVPIILSGRITTEGENTCLCPALRKLGEQLTTRNLPTMISDAGDPEREGWENGFLGLIAYLLSLKRESLTDHVRREERKRATRTRLLAAVFAALAIAAGVLGLIAKQNQDKATAAQAVAEQKVRESSRSDFHVGQRRLEQGKWSEALAYFARALSNDPGNRNAEDALLMSLLYGSRDDGLLPVAELPADRFATEYEFSPDGSRVLAISSGAWIGDPEPPGSLQLWSSNDGSRIGPERKFDSSISAHKFSLDGRRLFITTKETEITLDTATGEIVQPTEEDIAKSAGVISPDSSKYCYSIGRLAVVADTSTGTLLHKLDHESPVVTVAWSSYGDSVFTASTLTTGEKPVGVVQLWSLDGGSTLGKPIAVETEVVKLQPSPDGKTLAIIDRNGDVSFWDTEAVAMRGQLRLGGSIPREKGFTTCWDVVFNDDVSRAIVVTKTETSEEYQSEEDINNWVQIYDLVNGHEVSQKFPRTRATPVQISDTGDMLLTIENGALTYRNLEDGKIVETRKEQDAITSIEFAPNREWALVTLHDEQSDTNLLRLINVAVNMTYASLDCLAGVFSPDGRRFAAITEGSIQLWEMDGWFKLGEIPSLWHWQNVVFSPDGAQLLATAFKGRWYPVGGVLYQTNLGAFQAELSLCTETVNAADTPSIASQQVEPILNEQPSAEQQLGPEPGMHPKGKPVWRETSRDGCVVATLVAIKSTVADDKPPTLALHLRDSTPESVDTQPLVFNDGSDINNIASFNSDGSLIAVLGTKVHVVEIATRNVVCTISDKPQSIGEICFSPDGRRILTATTGGQGDRYKVQLWDAHSGQPLWEPIFHDDPVSAISFVEQGNRIVIITSEPVRPTVTRIIDAATGLPIGPELRMFADYSFSDSKATDDTVIFNSEEDEENGSKSSKRTWRIRAGKRLGGDIAVQLAEVAGGIKIDPATGSVRSVSRADRLSQLPQLLQAIGNDSDWRDAVERTLPWSETTSWNHREHVNLSQYVAGLLASGDESAVTEAAILDPANEALPSLAPE